MKIQLSFLVLNVLSSFNSYIFLSAEIIIQDGGPLVSLTNGVLRGKWQASRATKLNVSRHFASFEGIPYAKAARFQSPVPVEKWEGVKDASVPGNVCPQINAATGNSLLDEDCLFLNVYVPMVNSCKSLPVMVWIHGGAFVTSAGSYHGPKYLMEKDIILVTINYRLGVLGFLNTEDGVVDGNMGLKDQIMALKWVQKYIEEFGGDPENVTIFGESAGGASAHVLMISPSTKGLFHKVISQSGTGISSQCLNRNPKASAINLAKELNCSVKNSHAIVECMKKKSVNEILLAQEKFPSTFGAAIDPNASDFSVLPDTPRNLAAKPLKNASNELPFIVGWNEREMILAAAAIFKLPDLLETLNKNWNEILPTLLNYRSLVAPEDLDRVSMDIRNFYLKETPVITNADFGALSNIFTDYFIVDILITILLHSKYNTQVYPFELTYRGHYSAVHKFGIKGEGPCHTDDLQYLFPALREPVKNWPDLIEGSEDEKFSRNMIELWTSFARTGKPVVSEAKDQWIPVLPGNESNSNERIPRLRWYNLNKDSKLMMESPDLAKRIEFWDNVFTKSSSDPVFFRMSIYCYWATVFTAFLPKIYNKYI